MDSPIINFTSERLAYGPLAEAHAELALRWANDFAVSGPRGMPLRPYAAETVRAWHERTRAGQDRAVFVIYEESGRPIGETGFTQLDFFHRTAEFGILIGETECWGKGYGTEATRRMLAYGFAQLRLHSVWLRVSSANGRGLAAYRRAGFREAGRLREAQWIDGQLCDIMLMDCLASEFETEGLGTGG
ncbi:MAG TPA: GNAT family protein [Roseiflexaceae bacterium]|nr:GNAT family protein [Roseiflexaceae bacterium]